jgi:Ycf66 protein N-terminus
MLHSLLAWTMGLGSLGLFASGFFLPEIRRKNDLIWSGIGLFYALVMTVDSGRLRGGMILEELASVILIVWFALQILQQRRRNAPSEKLTPLPNSMETWTTFLKEGWSRLQQSFSDPDALEALYAGEEEDSLLDIGKLSATITGFFKKGDSERPASVSVPSPSASDSSSTGTDDWGDEVAAGPEDSATTPVNITTTTGKEEIASSEDETSITTSVDTTPETETEAPAIESQTVVEEPPLEPDVSEGPVESVDSVDSTEAEIPEVEMGDRTEVEASSEQVAQPETLETELSSELETPVEDSESPSEKGSHESESWPPPDEPT